MYKCLFILSKRYCYLELTCERSAKKIYIQKIYHIKIGGAKNEHHVSDSQVVYNAHDLVR